MYTRGPVVFAVISLHTAGGKLRYVPARAPPIDSLPFAFSSRETRPRAPRDARLRPAARRRNRALERSIDDTPAGPGRHTRDPAAAHAPRGSRRARSTTIERIDRSNAVPRRRASAHGADLGASRLIVDHDLRDT